MIGNFFSLKVLQLRATMSTSSTGETSVVAWLVPPLVAAAHTSGAWPCTFPGTSRSPGNVAYGSQKVAFATYKELAPHHTSPQGMKGIVARQLDNGLACCWSAINSGFAFVYMRYKEDGDEAVRRLDRTEWGYKRRQLRVEWAQKTEADRKRDTRPSKTLFVVNFDVRRTTERDIERFFSRYGRLMRVQIKKNYSFVQFADVESAVRAMERCNGAQMEGRTLAVEYVQNEDPNIRVPDFGRDDRDYGRDRERDFGRDRDRSRDRGYRGRERSRSRSRSRGRRSPERSPPRYERRASPPPRGRSRSPVPERRDRSPSYER